MNIPRIYLFLCFIFWIGMLQAQEQPEIVVTSGHISNVYCVNFSPNNRFVVTTGMDKTVRIWDRSLGQEFRVMYGHTSSVWYAVYTSDNKYILSVDEKGTLIVWNHATGAIVKRHKLDMFTRKFAYIPNTTRLLTKKTGKIVELDFLTGEIVGEHGMIIDAEIRLTNDGKHLITRIKDKINGVSIYDYKNKKVDGELIADHDKAIQNIAVSPDGKRVAAFSIVNKKVTIWNLESREIISSFEYPNKNLLEMAFTPNNKDILLAERSAKIAVYNVKTGKLKRKMNQSTTLDPAKMKNGAYRVGTAWDISISPDNKMVAVAEMLNESLGAGIPPTTFMGVLLFDYKRNQELGRLKGYFKMASHLSVGSNGKYLISSVYNKHAGIRVWNMKEGNLERFIPTSGVASASADGNFFGAWVIGDKEKPIVTVFNAKNLKPVFETTDVDALSEIVFNADGSRMVTQEVALDLANPMNNKFFFRVWDVATKKQLGKRIEFSTMEMPIFKALQMSPDGNYIIAQINSSEFTCWEVATGKRIQSMPSQIGYEFILDFIPNSNRLLISKTKPEYDLENAKMKADMTWFEWDFVTGEVANEYNTGKEGILFSGDFSEDGQYLVTGQGGYFNEINFDVVKWDWNTKKPICTMKGHHGEIKFVWYGAKGKRVYSSAQDGFIKVWEAESCELAGSLIAQDELDYIILSPDNYYKSSKGNNEGIGFRYNSNLYTFDQFDIRFNRPDKVLTSLGVSKYSVKLYTKAWEKRLKRIGFAPDDLNGALALPQIELPSKVDLPVTTEEKTLKFDIKAWDEVHDLDRISIYVNDVPSPQLQGISLRKNGIKSLEKKLSVDLSAGKNLVKVSVFNKEGLESLRESFQIHYSPTNDAKPNLYIFTIGVSEFEDKERNLKFATKDAMDLVKKFEESNYFGAVYAEELYNEDVTKKHVQDVASFLKKARTDDQVIIYISSHGLLDEELNYYLATHDIDFNNPGEKGLPYDIINNMLDGLPCRNRLVMIDACHSGEVDKDEAVTRSSIAATNSNVRINHKSGNTLIRPKAGLKNSFTYMKTLFNDVSKGTGATVISAAGGYEFALESEDWNNGVFTYAMLEGLTSGAADMNDDGEVRVSELKDYVTSKVVDLTDGKQHPTTRSENSLNDFVLFKVKTKYQKMIHEGK